MEIQKIEKLLEAFLLLPEKIKPTTYLGLCRYPTHRFEEICSRLLVFYLNPKNEHQLNDLVFKSLYECVNSDAYCIEKLSYDNDIKVDCEEYAEGKRIDIVITGKNFIIGIENKITADLYNPLNIYLNKLNKAQKKHACGIVLSLKKIQKKNELDLMRENKFINVLYSKLFMNIKNNLEHYSKNGNERHLLFLDDLIKTIENMENNYTFNPQIDNFFFENSDKLDQLNRMVSAYKQAVYKKKSDELHSLFHELREHTSLEWEMWENKALFYKMESSSIGIECWFEETKENPLGKFFATITSWEPVNFEYFKSLKTKFANKRFIEKDNRPYYFIEELVDAEHSVIFDKLVELSEVFVKEFGN